MHHRHHTKLQWWWMKLKWPGEMASLMIHWSMTTKLNARNFAIAESNCMPSILEHRKKKKNQTLTHTTTPATKINDMLCEAESLPCNYHSICPFNCYWLMMTPVFRQASLKLPVCTSVPPPSTEFATFMPGSSSLQFNSHAYGKMLIYVHFN